MNQDKVTQAVFEAIQFTSDGKQLEGELCETLAKGIAAGINAALKPIIEEEVIQTKMKQHEGGIQPKTEENWVKLHEGHYTPCEVFKLREIMNHEEILNLKINSCDFDEEITIRDYFKELLINLWYEKESFSGKRPFGNSGWQADVYIPLIKAGVVPGLLDEYGDIGECDEKKADRVILECIKACFSEPNSQV